MTSRIICSLLTTLLLLALDKQLYAQSNFYEEEYKSFSGGALIGLNLAQVDGDRYFGYKKPGIVAGVFVNVQLSAKWGLGVEMLYSQKGSRGDAVVESVYAGTYIAQCHIGLSYIELPVVVRYKKSKYVGEAGISYNRLVKTNETILEPQPLYIDAEKNRFSSTDINYVLGIGRHLHKQLHCGVRFHYSIVDIRPMERIPSGYGYGTRGQFNNLFSIRLIYQL